VGAPSTDTRDGRRVRGDRTRQAILRESAAIASRTGLSSCSLAAIADGLDISKSGVAAAFADKEELQLATVEAATELFVELVITPVVAEPRGVSRLLALVDAWIEYVTTDTFPGGCFMAGVLPEYDSRPGPIRDALVESRRLWMDFLTGEAAYAQKHGELDGLAPEDVAFEIDALLAAANLARNLSGDSSSVEAARRIARARLVG
jgi:AcrR family transcriptional regulator